MTLTAIPYFFMRGGTSRGPYVRRADLPEDCGIGLLLVMAGGLNRDFPPDCCRHISICPGPSAKVKR